MPVKNPELKDIIPKVRKHGFNSLTSWEFEVALDSNLDQSARTKLFEDLPVDSDDTNTSEDWGNLLRSNNNNNTSNNNNNNNTNPDFTRAVNWTQRLDDAAHSRWMFKDLITATNNYTNQFNNEQETQYTINFNNLTTDEFFDRLFQLDANEHNRPRAAQSHKGHVDLFKALVKTAQEHKTDKESYRKLEQTFETQFTSDNEETKFTWQNANQEQYKTYSAIFKALFSHTIRGDDPNNHKNKIIQKLKKYGSIPKDGTIDAFTKARAAHLESYTQNSLNPHATRPEPPPPPPTPENSTGTFSPTSATITGNDSFWEPENEEQRKTLITSSVEAINQSFNKKDATNRFTFQLKSNDDKNIEIKAEEKSLTIHLTATQQNTPGAAVASAPPSFNVTLTRKDEQTSDGKPTVTWTCDAKESELSKALQFKLIAVQSLALRQKQNLGADTTRIGIVKLNGIEDKARTTQPTSFSFNSRPPTDIKLAHDEIKLIEAHFDAGYTEVYYDDVCYKPAFHNNAVNSISSIKHIEAPANNNDDTNDNDDDTSSTYSNH